MRYDKNMYTICIVEDDEIIASKMKQYLESWNYQVGCIHDFSNVLHEFIQMKPDLVLMDVTLPYFNGYHWTQEIRKISKVPIVFISSADENMNVIMALSQGADDYITKPFDLQILTSKIQAILRRTYDFTGKSNILECDSVRFLVDENMVHYQDKEIELTKNEGRILRLLMERKGTIVSRESLMEYLWKTDYYVDENALSVNVNRLRKKLADIGIVDFIHTKKGMGYSI